MSTLKAGDLVMSKSGGGPMVLEKIVGGNKEFAECMWHDGETRRKETYSVDMLRAAPLGFEHTGTGKEGFFDDDRSLKDLAQSIQVSELLVATSEDSDDLLHPSIQPMLKTLLQQLRMDVVFVSEFVNGRRVFKKTESTNGTWKPTPGESDALEETWCQRVVDGRLPKMTQDVSTLAGVSDLPYVDFDIGAYLATPVVLSDGRVYGTLCCFSKKPNDKLVADDLKNLEKAARFTAKYIEQETSMT